jgi:hypothetical protein
VAAQFKFMGEMGEMGEMDGSLGTSCYIPFIYIMWIYIYIHNYIYIYISHIYILYMWYISLSLYIYVICRAIKDLKKPTGPVYMYPSDTAESSVATEARPVWHWHRCWWGWTSYSYSHI